MSAPGPGHAPPAERRVVRILGVGAAHGLVRSLRPGYEEATGFVLAGEYDTVGTTSAKLRGGAAADVAILSRATVDDLSQRGVLLAETAVDLGRTLASIAVKSDRGPLTLTGDDDVREALLAAPLLFVPDTETSTAGRHFRKVLAALGLAEAVAGKLVVEKNAAATVRALVACAEIGALGCVQSTEVVGVEGLYRAIALPGRLALSTVYTAAVVASAAADEGARALVRYLAAPETRASRRDAGFMQDA